MKAKITPSNIKYFTLNSYILIFALLVTSSNFFAQVTITDVFPTRVTTGSKVTITGANFTTTNRDNIRLRNSSGIYIGTTNHVLNNTGQMTFEISSAGTGDINDILNATLSIGTALTGPFATKTVSYIAPKREFLTNTSSFLVNEIFTNWDNNGTGFWSSQQGRVNGEARKGTSSPNDKHELLGYRVGVWPGISTPPTGIIYSTGVADDYLEAKLVANGILTSSQLGDPSFYRKKIFKAYSTNGVQGNIKTDSHYILAADLMDKDPVTGLPLVGAAEAATDNDLTGLTEINALTIFDVIIDGKNGLELGTGISNFNAKTDVQFISGNGQPGAVADGGTPDLLITQMAAAGKNPGKDNDLYFYAKDNGDVLGRPIKLYIDNNNLQTQLAWWRLDLYSFPGGDFASATPNKRAFTNAWPDGRNQYRAMWMAAFQLEDFGIDGMEVEEIDNVNLVAGGTADIAFMAYNLDAFKIKAPVAKPILPTYVCRVDGTSSIVFNAIAGIENGSGGMTDPDPLDPLIYKWSRNNVAITPAPIGASLTVTNIDYDDLGTYKVKISNSEGTIIIPIKLSEGGTPYIWDGVAWSLPPVYSAAGMSVDAKDMNLIFAADYNQDVIPDENENLEGCDCLVASGVDVTILEGKNMKLYGAITVAPEVPFVEGETDYISAGTFTLENNASLVQIKDVNPNENSGNILAKRNALTENNYDYVYWSSPVEVADLSMIPGATSHVYEWQVNTENANKTLGNWIKKSGVMENGRGYIKRVNDPTTIKSAFLGIPNNGVIDITVYKSKIENITSGKTMDDKDKHLNLIGNPYPSAINAETFLVKNINLEGYVKVWTHDEAILSSSAGDPFYGSFKYNYGDQYITYNKVGTVPYDDNAFGGIIASSQGFFVKVLESAAPESQVTFTNNMRYDEFGEPYSNSGFKREISIYGEAVDTEKQLIWLSLVNEVNVSAVTLVGYTEGATNGNDRLYDARSGNSSMRIYSVLDDLDLLIQGRALPFQDGDIVPLGVEFLKNGIYKIGIDHLKGSLMLNEDQGIFLEDTYNNVIHNLKISPYSFTATTGDIKDRFVLRYMDKTLSVDDKEISDTFVYVKNEQLYVKASKNIESVVVYDLTGKKLMDYKLDGYSDNFNTQFQFSRGAYLTVIKLENTGVITKKVIN